MAEALRHKAEHTRHIEHVIVIRKVVARDVVDPGIELDLPGGRANAGRDFAHLILFGLACPVSLDRALEFALPANSRIAEV